MNKNILLTAGIVLLICTGCGSREKEVFADCLTEKGSGLARQVEASFGMIKSADDFKVVGESGSDIRWCDAGKFTEDEEALLIKSIPTVTYNEDTVFTENILEIFQPELIMEQGKNPGLGVKQLHERGITGKGISIAIIDQVLYTGHPEYASKLALYEEVHVIPEQTGSMHGAALASISVGESCGVAPEARLYYWACDNVKSWRVKADEEIEIAWEEYARTIDRIIEVNRKLPEKEKIRVVGIARGYGFTDDKSENKEISSMLDAIKRAEEEGIFVVTTSTEMNYDFFEKFNTDAPFAGLGKIDPAENPDDIDNYTLGIWQRPNAEYYQNSLLIPMDNRTTADMSGDTYVHYADGGWSWTVPYVVGMYALCVEVKPDITPEEFYQAAVETAFKINRTEDGEIPSDGETAYTYQVLNPVGLIDYLSYLSFLSAGS